MKNVPSYFNCNSDQTILTATSLEGMYVFLHACPVPVKLNWSTVARTRQNCEVSGAPHS
jgi:phosphatidate phosphatase APP1